MHQKQEKWVQVKQNTGLRQNHFYICCKCKKKFTFKKAASKENGKNVEKWNVAVCKCWCNIGYYDKLLQVLPLPGLYHTINNHNSQLKSTAFSIFYKANFL